MCPEHYDFCRFCTKTGFDRFWLFPEENRSKTMVKNRVFAIIVSNSEFHAHSFSRKNSPEPKMLKYVVFSGIGGGEGGKFTGANPDFWIF